MMGGYGPGYMMRGYGGGYGPGMMGGYGSRLSRQPGYQGNLNLTTDQVKQYLEQMIRNPNLKVGDVKEKDADTIVAEIVTKQRTRWCSGSTSTAITASFNRSNDHGIRLRTAVGHDGRR